MLAHPPPAVDAIFPTTGYQAPQYTQIPDLLLDYQMAHLSGAELKVALYICRRTFGFKKNTDTISFNQMLEGIVTHEGRRLDYGTGLSRDSLAKAIKSLEAKRVILVLRSEDEKGSKQINLYALNIGQPLTPVDEPQRRAPAHAQVPPQQPRPPAGGSPENGLGGSPKIVLGGSTENGLGGSPKIVLTINSSNNKQHNNKQNNNTAPSPIQADTDVEFTAVVVALQAVGLSSRVARQLAAEFSPERIREKLAYLAFLQEKDAVTHPAGWLRRAIVEDYARPDGFLTPEEQVARMQVVREEQVSLLAEQLETQRAIEEQRAALAAGRTHQLQRLRQAHQVQPDDQVFGDEVMALLQNSCAKGSLLYTLLPLLAFLKYDAQHAVFAVENATALKQLQHPGTQTSIRRALRFLRREAEPHLKQEDIRLEFCLMEEDDNRDPVVVHTLPLLATQDVVQAEQRLPTTRKTRRRET